jgi:hypothetical protein
MKGILQDYMLMHKEIPVAQIQLDSVTTSIASIGVVQNPEHVPVGISMKKGKIARADLHNWWVGRAIPASRSGLNYTLERLGFSSSLALLDKCLGLSLSDQYWICPVDQTISWSDVNFFHNTFSEDVGNALFGHFDRENEINLMSPDNTSDGWLKKKWVIRDGKRYLLKGGSGTSWQEPYNEVLASKIMERLNIPHVSYTLVMQDGYPYCMCEDFITTDTELVTAWYIMRTIPKENHISRYRHYLECCDRLGIPNIQVSLDQMIVLDYLLVNEDRHQNNFGAIRNTDTLKWLRAAPIYDSGSSLWFDKPTQMIGTMEGIICKPFKSSHEEQIKLVNSFDWLDLDRLTGIEEEFRELTKGSVFIEESRSTALCRALKQRVKLLEKIVDSHHNNSMLDTSANDVKKDIAYSG